MQTPQSNSYAGCSCNVAGDLGVLMITNMSGTSMCDDITDSKSGVCLAASNNAFFLLVYWGSLAPKQSPTTKVTPQIPGRVPF